jgi:hypothetical protein
MLQMIAIKQNAVSRMNVASRRQETVAGSEVARRRWTLLLAVSGITTVIMAVLGLALGTVSLLHLIPAENPLTTIGVVLLASTFPGLIFTAHCLDRIDDAMHAIKMADYEQRLLEITEGDEMN